MENNTDPKRFLEDTFSIGRSVGPFFVPFSKGEPLVDIRDRVAARARDIWPWSYPNNASPIYIRVFLWEREKPKSNDNLQILSEFTNAVIEGVVSGGMILSQKQIQGIWAMRDHYKDIPSDMISIQVVWGV